MNIRDVQKVQIQTLKDISSFCDRNRIRYYLYCGTLLGCIRHGGFIPWDDDIDLAMPLNDYKRFSELIRKDRALAEKYSVIGGYDSKDSAWLWIKINRKNTIYYDKQYLDTVSDKGISMDIYPMIGEFDARFPKKLQRAAIRLQHYLFLIDHYKFAGFRNVWNKRLIPFLKIIAVLPYKTRAALIGGIKRLFWPAPEKCRYCGTIDAAAFWGKYEYKQWVKTTEGSFEGGKYTIPAAYDQLLRRMYGNYMELPPEEKRTSRHMTDAFIEIGRDVAEEAGIEL